MRSCRPAPASRVMIGLLGCMFLFTGCSLPRIIFLHDPLTPEEHDNLGRVYESQGKTALALDQYREALRKDRKRLPSLLLFGDCAFRTNDYGAAESAYRTAMDLDPENGDIKNNLAWVYIQQGKKLETAKKLASEAIVLNPGNRPFYLDTLGVALLKLKDPAAAVAALKESLTTLPEDRPELIAEAEGHLAEAVRALGNHALRKP